MSIDVKAVEEALEGLRMGFVADGYDLKVEDLSAGVARIRILAGPEACEECLVPKEIMAGMLEASLEELPEIKQVELLYPED